MHSILDTSVSSCLLSCVALPRLVLYCQEGYSHEKAELLVEERDVNDETSDTITSWACATREVLYRVVEGVALVPASE